MTAVGARTRSRPLVVAATVLAAVVVNLALYGIGHLAGGSYRFTNAGAGMHVDPLTVVGFTIVPLTLGVTAAALLSLRWPVFIRIAMVVGPVLALGSILVMTLPADFDLPSKIALAACHVALVPVMLLGLRALERGR